VPSGQRVARLGRLAWLPPCDFARLEALLLIFTAALWLLRQRLQVERAATIIEF
jgi:hypothetical protein